MIKPYRFTKSEMELIESHGITAGMVSKRVKTVGNYMKQWTHQKVRVCEYREKKTIERLNKLDSNANWKESERKRLS